MMTRLLTFLLVCIAANTLRAQLIYRMSWTDDTHTEARMDLVSSSDLPLTVGVESYDNWRGSDWVDPGRTEYTGHYRVGGREVADDFSMTVSGMLTSTKWSYVNLSETQTITRYRITDSWYSHDGALLLRVHYNTVVVGGVPPQFRAIVFQEDGFWSFLQLELPQNVQYSKTFSNPVDFDVNDFGVIVGGPHNTGSSSRYVRDMTTGDLIDLGSENSNFALGVRVNAVPAPGVAAVATLGLIGALRRRRR